VPAGGQASNAAPSAIAHNHHVAHGITILPPLFTLSKMLSPAPDLDCNEHLRRAIEAKDVAAAREALRGAVRSSPEKLRVSHQRILQPEDSDKWGCPA
jgi:hypothetical protein